MSTATNNIFLCSALVFKFLQTNMVANYVTPHLLTRGCFVTGIVMMGTVAIDLAGVYLFTTIHYSAKSQKFVDKAN